MTSILAGLFRWVLYSSISAGVIALIFILLRMIFKSRIAPKIFCMLWLLVIIKLIVTPFAPGSRVSLFNVFNRPLDNYIQETTSDLQSFTAPSDTSNSAETAQPNSTSAQPEQTADKTFSAPESTDDSVIDAAPDPVSVLSWIWVAGLLFTACVFMGSGAVFYKRLKNSERIPEAQLPVAVQSYIQKQHKSIKVYSSSGLVSPCVIGIIRPRIILPQQVLNLSEQQLTHILMHEIAHLIRKDYLINIAIAAVNVVHWFNPILWYAMKLFNMDREVSCDNIALEILGQDESIPYGMTLIQLSRVIPENRLQFGVSNFLKSEKQINRRIIMIKKFKKGSSKISAAVLVLCLLIGMVTLTNAVGVGPGAQDQINALLGNSSYMYFNSLERAQNYSEFSFEVPDYLPSGFELYSIFLHKDKIDKNDIFDICYWSTTDGGKMVSDQEEHHFSLSVSKGNLLQYLKSNTNATYEEEKVTINDLSVTNIAVHTKQQVNQKKANFVIMDTVKHLVWQDQGVWYNLEYYVSSKADNGTEGVYENMSMDDLKKIVSSMKAPKDIKNVDYKSGFFQNSFAIYNEADLKNAEKLLGFTPKFPLHITDGLNVSSAYIGSGTYFENDKGTPFLKTVYSAEGKENASKTLEIEQGKLSSLFDSIVKSNSMSLLNTKTGKNESVSAKVISVANVNVFAFDVTFENQKMYVWAQNGVYYSATFSGIDQPESILNGFIALNP